MAKGSVFGDFQKSFKKDQQKFGVKPIVGSFGGSAPDSLYSSNVQSAWARWRRGMELAVAHTVDNQFSYSFQYLVPSAPGQQNNIPPTIGGTFVGYPTPNKELGMHWAGSLNGGNLRFDELPPSGTLTISGEVPRTTLFNGREQNNEAFWYIQINGLWTEFNPLPPPIFVQIQIPGLPPTVLKPINGFILGDRIIASGDPPITRNSRDDSNAIYGYTEAVLADVDGPQGILQLKKQGSVRATPEGTFNTPAKVPPAPGRFFVNGPRYCCSCQDFTQRDYFYASTLMGLRKGKLFPRSSPASLKPGRYEKIKTAISGTDIFNEPLNLDAQVEYNPAISGMQEREMLIVTPSGTISGDRYQVDGMVNEFVAYPGGNRDFPGVFRDFGRQYLTQYGNNPDAVAPTYPQMKDYDSVPGTNGNPHVITAIEDYWYPTLDEVRRCKHIYAMLYTAKQYGPEPSDYPVEEGSIVAWEDKLVADTEKAQDKAAENLLYYGLSRMDVPPYNAEAPMMFPMLQRLTNLPAAFLTMDGFRMLDPNTGEAYNPSAGETPATVDRDTGF